MNYKEKFLRLSSLHRKARRYKLTYREARERDRLRRLLKRKIKGVMNDYARYCMECRYLDGMIWDDIADSLGHHTHDAVRKICERTIKRM